MHGRIATFIKEYTILTAASLGMAVGIYFFEFLNGFTTGGISGISIILGACFPQWSAGGFMLAINAALLLLGFLILGGQFGIKTFYCGLLVSLGTYLLERLVPRTAPLTDEPMLETVFMVVIPSLTGAVLFYFGASSGGTDILALIIKKFSPLNISWALFLSDLLIVMLLLFSFGIEAWLFSLLGFFARVLLVNFFLNSVNAARFCTVITSPEHREAICDYITNVLQKSATVSEAFLGAYQNEKKSVLLVALTRRQASRLKAFAKTLDEKTFIIVSGTSEIVGEGFREIF
ncbi:MAG: YitT family protein [Clostridia bacterium]|nr:YitT family protein [Clostridia bacterium]